MMANTTQESAGTPWKKLRIGAKKRSTARERTIRIASAAPITNAPASPPRMRPTVASTCANCGQSTKISSVRQNTSRSGGNRYFGKYKDAICQSAASATNGAATSANRRKWELMAGDNRAGTAVMMRDVLEETGNTFLSDWQAFGSPSSCLVGLPDCAPRRCWSGRAQRRLIDAILHHRCHPHGHIASTVA